MWDLWAAGGLLGVVVAACGAGGFMLGRRWRRWGAEVVIALSVLLAWGFVMWMQDSIWLARLMPWSAVLVLGMWALPLSGLVVGVVWGSAKLPALRKTVFSVALLGVATYSSTSHLWGAPPPCDALWRDGVCLQTTQSSCGPAAAATLLHLHGIESSEAEMARLCLTRSTGTTLLGLYRGLRLKAAERGMSVELLHGTIDDLRRLARPAVIWVELPDRDDIDPRYREHWGWEPGVRHAVVLLGFDGDGQPIIGEPAVGRERWGIDGLTTLWSGEAMALRGGSR